MAQSRRYLKSKGTESPAPRGTFRFRSRVSFRRPEAGMMSIAELAVGVLVIGLLLMVAVSTLKVTEVGTIKEKKQQQSLDLAKGKAEELKSYLASLNWDNMTVDQRFPPTQTPVVSSYNSYAPTTIVMGGNSFILKPEVRYVYNDAISQLEYVPTPGTASTPEVSDLVRIRVDCFYGPTTEWSALPTVEAKGVQPINRVTYSNLLSHRTINVGGVGEIQGHITSPCFSTGVAGVEVGLYQGPTEMFRALTDVSGLYFFNNVTAGTYTIQIASSPGYGSQGPCDFTNPVSLAPGTSLLNQDLGVTLIPSWNYFGVAVFTTPVVNSVIPTSPTPTPNPTPAAAIPAANAFVFANDGNSKPVTANGSGAYTITQVRSTPVAGHSYDTIEADNLATTQTGQNYNIGTSMYPYSVSGGQTYIGPITVYMNSTISNTIPVTFVILDETSTTLFGNYYPITLTVADGSPSPPSTILSNPNTTAILNVHPGAPQITVGLNNNNSPVGRIAFNQTMSLGVGTAQPITLFNYAVGSMGGTVAGMGAAFDYSQFTVRARDIQGQYAYDIPVVYDGVSTFGTFNYSYLRAPMGPPVNGHLSYNFTADSGGQYTSTLEQQDAIHHTQQYLNNPIFVAPLNVYAAVTVTQNGSAYPYGSWVSAQMVPSGTTPPSGPPTTGLGNGYTVSNYFSTLTKGDGTGFIQVQLSAGAATTYVFSSQIVDAVSYATSTQSQTVVVRFTNTFSSPLGVNFAF